MTVHRMRRIETHMRNSSTGFLTFGSHDLNADQNSRKVSFGTPFNTLEQGRRPEDWTERRVCVGE